MDDIEYVREEDKQEYQRFAEHHVRNFGRAPVGEIWHYTTTDGLIGILKSGQIWSTQVTCLNDSLEHRYFGSLVHARVKAFRAQNTDANLGILFRISDELLATDDYSTVGEFVACFSEIEDDLGQWRGYGGGECGYAIGFRFEGIIEALQARRDTFLLPMHYEDQRHQFLVNEVLN